MSRTCGNAIPPVCEREFMRARGEGASLAEMLRYQQLDANGAQTGVVYARNFGSRNERLRARFGDRAWYVARVTGTSASRAVQLEPYR